MVHVIDEHCWHDNGATNNDAEMTEHFYCCWCSGRKDVHYKLSYAHLEGHGKHWKPDGALHPHDAVTEWIKGTTGKCPDAPASTTVKPL